MSLREQLRVMVVDDTATSRGLITDALGAFGIQHVRSANSGTAALADLAAHPAHLVISDMNMPGMDGLQLLSALRKAPRTAKVGFLLITGRANNEIISEGKRLGMNNFVAKPFENKDLLRAVEAIVGRI
jgi:two-component system, chemotaxis family, chemotaxis protein CheY